MSSMPSSSATAFAWADMLSIGLRNNICALVFLVRISQFFVSYVSVLKRIIMTNSDKTRFTLVVLILLCRIRPDRHRQLQVHRNSRDPPRTIEKRFYIS
jgi:hypothetical protein